MKSTIATAGIALTLVMSSISFGAEKPNIVVIISDDQGYADVSYNPHHPPEVQTPHTDSLAREGIVCTQGYTTGHVCSPTGAPRAKATRACVA